MTENQLEAWSWFCGLQRDWRSSERDLVVAAGAQLRAVEAELTRDEYLVLTEDTRSSGRTAERIGRSRDTARALSLSALRKLVIYRHMQGIGAQQ